MYEFTSLSNHKMKGGMVSYQVSNPSDCTHFEHIRYEKVMLDGDVYRVYSIESRKHSPPYEKGVVISLLVDCNYDR